jgi:hypothetical protein
MNNQTNNTDGKFPDGFIVKDATPDYILANVSIKSDEFIAWLNQNTDERGWANLTLKKNDAGKTFAMRDDWKPTQQAQATTTAPTQVGRGFPL